MRKKLIESLPESISSEGNWETGVAHQNIIKCCKNQRPYAGGYEWKYN